MNATLDRLEQLALVPVVAIEDAGRALQLAEALLAGGLPCAEITFRTQAAEAAIRAICTALPEMVTGAGTVLTVEQAKRAAGSGARFVVSPGFNPKVVDWCLTHVLPVVPGVATPTDIGQALDCGLTILKFFPAEALGGVPMLKALGAPFGEVRFIPTGGISAQNLADYLKLPMVFACGGSWMVASSLISNGAFDEITRLTRAAVSIVKQSRGGGARP